MPRVLVVPYRNQDAIGPDNQIREACTAVPPNAIAAEEVHSQVEMLGDGAADIGADTAVERGVVKGAHSGRLGCGR